MTEKEETSPAKTMDTVKTVFALVILVAGVGGFYYFSEKLLLYRVLGILATSAMALMLILSTDMGKGFILFLDESKREVRKMIWPTRQETAQATMFVVALVFFVGIVLWLLDMFLFWGIGKLTGVGS